MTALVSKSAQIKREGIESRNAPRLSARLMMRGMEIVSWATSVAVLATTAAISTSGAHAIKR